MLKLVDLDLCVLELLPAVGKLRLGIGELLFRLGLSGGIVGLALLQLSLRGVHGGPARCDLAPAVLELLFAVLELLLGRIELRLFFIQCLHGLAALCIQLRLCLLQLQIALIGLALLKLAQQQIRRFDQPLRQQGLGAARLLQGKALGELAARDLQGLILHEDAAVIELLLRGVDLGLCGIELVERVLLCLREGGKAFVILLLPGLQLLFAAGQLGFCLREAGAVVFQLLRAVVELRAGVSKLLLGLRAPLLIFRKAVVIFLLRLGKRIARLVDDVVIALLRALLQRGGQRRTHGVDGGIVGIGIEVRTLRAIQQQVNFRKIVHGERLRLQQHEAVQCAAAEARRTALRAEIQRCFRKADDGEGRLRERIVHGRSLHRERFAEVGLREAVGIGKALVRTLRHAPGRQAGAVDRIGERQSLERHALVFKLGREVDAPRALGSPHAVQPGKIIGVLLRQAERADKTVVKQLRFLHILRSGAEHGGLRDLQARKKTDAEGNDGDDGQKPPE